MQPALEKLFAEADENGAHLAISAVTVQEYLVRPRTLGETEWHKARGIVDQFTVLSFDRAAAEAAATLELKKNTQHTEMGGSRTEAKKIWFRDAAIVGTAIARGAEKVFTHDGPMAGMHVTGISIVRV